jgi:hypothetical protein
MPVVPVLVDTNVILEAHRTNAWKALRGGLRLETVEACIVETQTGAQRRRPEQRIDEATLRADFKAVHGVTDRERAVLMARDEFVMSLDPGELALWSHAFGRGDAWVLCGPDRASLRLGIRLGLAQRLVSLEDLLAQVGRNPAPPLRPAYCSAWHRQTLARLAQEEGINPV